jgi:hypothetical protein
MGNLTVTQRDPFTAGGDGGNRGTDGRIAGARWFADLYEQLDIPDDAHMRRIHYRGAPGSNAERRTVHQH